MTGQRVPIAHAGDWELSSLADPDSKWIHLQLFDPDAEQEAGGDEQVTAATLALSDVEALDLWHQLGSYIAHVTPALMPDLDTSSSASRQHFICTGRYLAVGEVTE